MRTEYCPTLQNAIINLASIEKKMEGEKEKEKRNGVEVILQSDWSIGGQYEAILHGNTAFS